jgi:hypothetical protein
MVAHPLSVSDAERGSELLCRFPVDRLIPLAAASLELAALDRLADGDDGHAEQLMRLQGMTVQVQEEIAGSLDTVTIDITPAGFSPDNPDAAANAQRANAASARLEQVIRAKADFLRVLVDAFGSIEQACEKLGDELEPDAGPTEEEVAELQERYHCLEREHDEAGEELLLAMSGRASVEGRDIGAKPSAIIV